MQSDVEIITLNQPVCHKDDFFTWIHNKSGQFSVKSAYWLASMAKFKTNFPDSFEFPSLNGLKERVWKVQKVPKIRVFIWKAMSSALPVAELINARGMNVDVRCQACGEEPESINHTLFGCHVVRQVWAMSPIPNPPGGFHESSVFSNLAFLLNSRKGNNSLLIYWRSWPWILWNLWKRRNESLFEGRMLTLEEVVLKSEDETEG